MTVTGIIAEFNPFHNGHKYLLEQTDGLKIVAMSGNFMQRGEPAIVDKWIRAQMALENGADLKDIQTMMGHADISSTQVYVQLLDSHFKEVYHNCHPRAKV